MDGHDLNLPVLGLGRFLTRRERDQKLGEALALDGELVGLVAAAERVPNQEIRYRKPEAVTMNLKTKRTRFSDQRTSATASVRLRAYLRSGFPQVAARFSAPGARRLPAGRPAVP